MRGRSAVRKDDLQLDLFGLRLPALQTVDAMLPEGRGALLGTPTEGGGRTGGDETPAPKGLGAPADGRGDEAEPVAFESPAEYEADNIVVLPPPNREPEPLRNQNNYRITDDDRVGLGSLKQKCRDNLAAIDLLKQIETENRTASAEEKRVLVRYVGWGGLPQVFDPGNEPWSKERDQLEKLLTPDELDSARATTLNAHYTSPVIIRAMYAALSRFGFESGRILEPACGLGHFIGVMPDGMHCRSQITGIEIDSVTHRLSRLLYPDADLRHQPFEEARLVDGYYDLAVGNIPFGDYKPFDPRFKKWNFVIHDYFFAATLAKVRPGGLILFITSKGTFDKIDSSLRVFAGQQADLLGAIRLPNDAFKKNAHTEVTTDLVMLRKRLPHELPEGPAWKELVPITNSLGETISVNEYFVARPEMMLGEMQMSGRMYGHGEPTLAGNGRDLAEQLAEAIARLPENIFQSDRGTVVPIHEKPIIPAPEHVKPHAYALVNGQIARREGDVMRVLDDLSSTAASRIRGLIRVRDSVRRCLRLQLDDAEESAVIVGREQLNQTYDHFVGKFGPISERANTGAFRGDPDLPLLLSLEHYDAETKRAAKAAIFRERTVQKQRSPQQVDSPQDALLVSLNERGRVDLDYISQLLHRPVTEFLAELKGAIFLNPQSNHWETEDEYLSGNVRAKLLAAEAAVLTDGQFQANVEALQAVQPADLNASEIDARLGSTWVPREDVQKFAGELLGETDITIRHAAKVGLWVVTGGWSAKSCVANTTEWGTDRESALELLEDALNLRTPTVYDYDDRAERNVVNGPATEAARDKQEKIKERFKAWIWQDDERCQRLVRKYNDEFNNVRLRTFNGEHLTLPGASPAITLRPHQKAAVWRILQTPNCLLAHCVGAGKTFVMTAAAMERRRLGLSRKPLFVVPNHMLGQFSSELLMLYPGANILVATRDDFEKTQRQTLMSRIATGNWDAVIVTHSGFEKIPLSRATQEEFFKGQMRELDLAIAEQRKDEGSRVVKMLEKEKKRLETKLKELCANERKDDTLTFEELGVDFLAVDEAHAHKNLFYISKMSLSVLSPDK